MFYIAPDDYGRIYRLLESGERVELEFNIENRFHEDHPFATNIIAEIPGSTRPEEIVMVGAHFDSHHGGTGVGDNGAGVAMVMEAIRILSTLDVPLARTVRLGLWGMEENPYPDGAMTHVFRNYIRPAGLRSGATSVPDRKRPSYGNFTAYFNLDHGSQRIRGLYSNGDEASLPLLREWLGRLESLGASTVSQYPISGSDHDVFNLYGLPGFMFIQDPGPPLSVFGYHGNGDTPDLLMPGDLRQGAAVVASLLYLVANDPRRIPQPPAELSEPDVDLERRISATDLGELTGSYSDGNWTVVIGQHEGVLTMHRTDLMAHWELFQYGPHEFFTGVARLEFIRGTGEDYALRVTTRNASRLLSRIRE